MVQGLQIDRRGASRHRVSSRGLQVLAALALLLGPSIGPARAQDVGANVGAYCRATYGPAATASIDRRDNGLMCTVRLQGGLSMRHYKITASRVCLAQHRTTQYRRSGMRVTCVVRRANRRGTPPKASARTINLAAHCRSAYGPRASLTTRRTDNRPMCTIRTNRGLGLRHHLVDLRRLCGSTRYRVSGARLHCAARGRQPSRNGATAARSVDLKSFCRRSFGPSAIVTRRQTDGRPMCSVRTNNGLGLRHHVIDPRQVCRGSRYRVSGTRIHCLARR